MNICKLIVDYLASLMTLYLGLICLSVFFKRKFKLNILNIIIILVASMLIVFYSYYGDDLTRPFKNLAVLFITSLLIYRENTFNSLLYVLICNVLIGFYEFIFSLFLITFKVVNLDTFDSNYLLKAVFSLIIMLLVLFTVKRNVVQKISSKIIGNKKLAKFIVILLLIYSLLIMVIEFNNTKVFSYEVYLGNIIMVACSIVILKIIVTDHINVQKEMDKSAILLNFMDKYEKTIDENRENNHELLNNLLVLKSFKNKNSKEYNNLLDELINSFNNKGSNFKNIYNLPSGIKGIFYYKLYGLEESGYKISINVSKKVKSLLKKINHDNYLKLSKIIAIVLDNAVEASSKTRDKLILIDIYSLEDNIIIEITNSFKGIIDINSINEKKYSTKGENRGYGLYVMNKIIKDNKQISVEQSTNNNLFDTRIIVKEK